MNNTHTYTRKELMDLCVARVMDDVTGWVLRDPDSLDAFLREQLNLEALDRGALEAQAGIDEEN